MQISTTSLCEAQYVILTCAVICCMQWLNAGSYSPLATITIWIVDTCR